MDRGRVNTKEGRIQPCGLVAGFPFNNNHAGARMCLFFVVLTRTKIYVTY